MKMNKQRPVSGNKKTCANKKEEVTKHIVDNRNKTVENDREISPTPSCSKSFKGSLIPKLIKDNHTQKKGILETHQKQNKISKRPTTPLPLDDYKAKLQKLEEKENVIAEYYNKIEALIQKIVEKRSAEKIKEKALQRKIFVKNCLARKMISDPAVFQNVKYNKNLFSEFESGVYEISDIWLKTSTDLANTLKNMKNDSYIYASDFETEKMKIQKAIKRARSFTLVKTKNVIAEARKLLIGNEIIRRGHKALLDREVRAKTNVECVKIPVETKTSNGIKFPGEICHKVKSSFEIPKRPAPQTKILNECEGTEQTGENTKREPLNRVQNETENIGDNAKSSEAEEKGKNFILALGAPLKEEIETWRENIAKSKEQVAVLKDKVFNLQRACNDYSIKCNDVQIRLLNFSKKIQCDEIFVDEIEKANENVSDELQPAITKVPEARLEDLVQTRVKKMNDELDVLTKLNNLLVQQKLFLDHQSEYMGDRTMKNPNTERNRSDHFKALEKQCEIAEKIVNEKRSAVGQLRGILDVMKHQESIALKQKALFEEKIEDLKKKQS